MRLLESVMPINARKNVGGRAGHGLLAFIHIGEALGCRDKRSRAYRRAIGDPVNGRWPK
jgi:hypothetical protein